MAFASLLSGASGGLSNSSSAGPATSGAGSVNVGGLDFGTPSSSSQYVGIAVGAGLVLLAVALLRGGGGKRRRR